MKVKLQVFVLLFLFSHVAFSGGPITIVHTEAEPATPSQYTKNGKVYSWGQGMDLMISGFEYGDDSFSFQGVLDRVIVRRNNNVLSNGEPCAIFVDKTGVNAYQYQPSYPSSSGAGNCDISALLAGRVVNRGVVDVFQNKGRNSFENATTGNIERIDFILNKGILAADDVEGLEKSGHIVSEKMSVSGKSDDELRIAAITKLSATGDPIAYGPVVNICSIDGCQFCDLSEVGACVSFGKTNIKIRTALLTNERGSPQTSLEMLRKDKNEVLAMAFVSLLDLGVAIDQTYYGFSLFSPDVNPNIHILTDHTTFPTNTKGGGGSGLIPGDADLFGGSASYFSSHACGFH